MFITFRDYMLVVLFDTVRNKQFYLYIVYLLVDVRVNGENET
jgi:hypothetical protein